VLTIMNSPQALTDRPKRREASNRNAVADEVRKRKEQQMNNEELHLALTEDISEVIAKHLPSFDNNIEAETWSLLMLFLDETIHQLKDLCSKAQI